MIIVGSPNVVRTHFLKRGPFTVIRLLRSCTSQLSPPTMGLLFSLPLAGSLGTIATSCLGGLAFCFTSTAGEYYSNHFSCVHG